MSYILYHQSIESATLTYSATATANYPETNLQDRYINTFFKDTPGAVATVNLIIDFGANRTCDFIILGNYIATFTDNAGATALRLDLDRSTASDFSSGVTNIFSNQSITSESLATKLLTTGFDSGGETQRYWRLTFHADGGDTIDELQIGTIYLGTKVTLSHSPELDITESNDYLVNTNQGVGGIRSGSIDNTTKRRLWNYPWKYLTETDKTNLETFRDSVYMNKGLSRYPFYWSPDTGSTLYYARTKGELQLKQHAFEAWQWDAQFEEEL